MLENLLRALCKELLIEMPEKSKDGSFFLSLSDSINVEFQQDENTIYLKAKIAPLSEKKREDTLLHIMRANLLGQGTGGFRIGLNPDEKTLTLQGCLPYDINYAPFKDRVEEFVNFVSYWQEENYKLSSGATGIQ